MIRRGLAELGRFVIAGIALFALLIALAVVQGIYDAVDEQWVISGTLTPTEASEIAPSGAARAKVAQKTVAPGGGVR